MNELGNSQGFGWVRNFRILHLLQNYDPKNEIIDFGTHPTIQVFPKMW